MDLTERGDGSVRHPWEVQRFEAYRRILVDHGALNAHRVLDVGAGDGWFSDRLAEHLPAGAEIVCWDVNYDDDDLDDLDDLDAGRSVDEPTSTTRRVIRTRERPDPGYDLVLLLDVIEHIEDPVGFIESALAPLTHTGTAVLVAVPAHRRLFGAHDVALGHFRRYGRRELAAQLDPWIRTVEDGSLFTGLLLPRALSVGLERVRPRRAEGDRHGVGAWSGGPLVTGSVNRVLAADARLGRAARRVGLRLPGLSNWVYGVVR
jgi:SAM-dependent methyltransferase